MLRAEQVQKEHGFGGEEGPQEDSSSEGTATTAETHSETRCERFRAGKHFGERLSQTLPHFTDEKALFQTEKGKHLPQTI